MAISLFDGYSKLQGILRARALDLPTLPGLVVDPVRMTDFDRLVAEGSKLHATRYLVRHDRIAETGRYPQGGYVIMADELSSELVWYRSQQRLLILLHPADPLDNLYSASALITFDRVLHLEIVGPGFDASDLNRGFISPFETHRFFLDPTGRARRIGSYYVDDTTYAAAKPLRLRKIALKFLLRRHFIDVEEMSAPDAIRLIDSRQLTSRLQIKHLLGTEPYQPAPAHFVQLLTRLERIPVTLKHSLRG